MKRILKNKKTGQIMIVGLLSLSMLTACGNDVNTANNVEETNISVEEVSSTDEASTENATDSSSSEEELAQIEDVKIEDNYLDETASVDTYIELSGADASIQGEGAEVSGNVINITAPGTYELSGNYEGQILVETEEDGQVQLILNGVEINNESNAPIYVVNSDLTIITLKEGTTNTIYDEAPYTEETSGDSEEERVNGAIHSKDDLVINGNGALNIEAVNKSGILGKDDVIILSGDINITADKNGIKGKDLVYVDGGEIQIKASTDGIESDEMVYINGGSLNIECAVDGLHSDQTVYIADGVVNIEAEDDGIHGDILVQIDGGEINILDSYEGIEAKDIVLNDGIVNLNASDDGINAVDESSTQNGPGQMGASYDFGLHINGGQLTLNSYGDGLDSNGNVWMTGGVVIVSGPTDNKNGSLDCDGTFEITGGYLVAAGSSGMLETPSTTSSVNSIVVAFDSYYNGGTQIVVEDASGNKLLDYSPEKEFSSVVLSSAELAIGESYTVSLDGAEYAEIELTDVVTTYGDVVSSFGGGKGGPKR